MKYNGLKLIAQHLRQYKNIKQIHRVDDTVIKIVFDKSEILFFDMKKGDSHIFKKNHFKRAKIYNAPFDVVLHKRFAGSFIEKIEIPEENRVLKFYVVSNSSYKSQKTILQLEFTGRNTNAIILDKNETVLEALRHIDSSVSYRSVKTGQKLKPLPPFKLKKDSEQSDIKDIEKFLYNQYDKRAKQRLLQIKSSKINQLQKKIDKFKKILNSLQNEEKLLKDAKKYNEWGTLILSNLHLLKPYEKKFTLKNWEGNEISIEIPKEARNINEGANMLFSKSKKLKQKAASLYKERENLTEKIEFLQKMQKFIKNAADENEINILFPKQQKTKKEQKEQKSYETFFIEGYKIMLGKNQKGNALLLKEAKKRDIWMHLKDIPSSHVIIKTDKQNIPQSVLDFAGKLCVEFSVNKKGTYLVDYTQRRNVKIIDGANVTYVDYKTIHFEE